MRSTGSLNHRSNFKLSIKALSICVLTLMLQPPLHAEEKTVADSIKDAAAVAAATAAFGKPTYVIDKSEQIVEEIPNEIKAAVEKRLISKLEIKKPEIDPAASEVFRAPIYQALNVSPLLGYIAVVDGEALKLSYRSSSSILAGYLKLIRDDFVLDSEEKAKLLEKAFQLTYPFKHSNEFKAPVKLDNGWLLIRDEFFKNHSGLVFTTDENGKITLIEYILKINPKDYSYKPPTNETL